MLDCTQLSYTQMADLVLDISKELKRRNPLYVNMFVAQLHKAAEGLEYCQDMKDDIPEMDEA